MPYSSLQCHGLKKTADGCKTMAVGIMRGWSSHTNDHETKAGAKAVRMCLWNSRADGCKTKAINITWSLQGHLLYIRRFILNLVGWCQPFGLLMRKDTTFEWDEACRNAFESIKRYPLNPPVLGVPIPGKPLVLYIAAQEQSLGALLAQKNEEEKEKTLYYLSRKLTVVELRYSSIEKMCLALFFSIQKVRHYMQAHVIHLVAKIDPVKYVLSRAIMSGRLAKWAVAFQEFEIVYVP